MYNVHVSGSWQQQKIILKSLSNWYLAQAYDRGIIFNFLIVLGKKWKLRANVNTFNVSKIKNSEKNIEHTCKSL